MVVVETFSSTNVENSLKVMIEIHGFICISIGALMVVETWNSTHVEVESILMAVVVEICNSSAKM